MRASMRAAVAAGLVVTVLVAIPGATAGAAGKPTFVHTPSTQAQAPAAAAAPLVSAFPPGVSHPEFLRALQHAIATGRMQHQTVRPVKGAKAALAPATSGFALPAGPPPGPCTTSINVAWPNVTDAGTPCYISTYQGQYVLAHGAQDVFPGQSAVLGVKFGPGTTQAGQVDPSAWQLSWNNLFDFQPLMRDTLGQTGNDITGYDNEFFISPSLDNTSCYTNGTGPDGGGFNAGRYENQCTIGDSGGPYYGTPAGQPVPWTLMSGAATVVPGAGAPVVFNCFAICPGPPSWQGIQIETPVMLEPSPYASFSDSIGADNKTVSFTDRTLSDLQITSWTWNFGDGTTSSAQNPVHTYAKGGQYTVSLSVSANNQFSTTSTTVTPPGSLALSSTVTPAVVEVGADGAIDVTVTNSNKDPVSGIEVSSLDEPIDSSFSVDASGTCISNCVDPLPAGASTVLDVGVTGLAENNPSVLDVVNLEATGTMDSVPVSGMATSPEVAVDNTVTVTAVDPTGGQIYGGDSVTITGTGFQDLLGADTVTKVDFVPFIGGQEFAASAVDVVSPTELTVDAPDVSSVVGPTETGVFDVVVSTAFDSSPVNADDRYQYGCQTETSKSLGNWLFSGCFNSPNPGEYASTTKATIDGLDVNPAGGASTVVFDADAFTLAVPSGGNVSATVGGTSTPVCNGPINWDLTGASVSCPAPGGHVLGLAATGPVTLTPQVGGSVKGSVPVRLPGILGATAGTLTFAASDGGGLTSASVAVPGTGSIAQLVTGKVISMTLNIGSGVWTATGTSTTSTGASATLSANLSFDSSGNLSNGTVNFGKIDLAGAVTLSGFSLGYDTSTKLWTGSPGIAGTAVIGAVSLAVTDTTGAVTAGTVSTGAISLFGAMPLDSLTLTYGASAWALASTPADTGGGTVSATFPVTSGQIAGATITQDGSPIALDGQFPSNAAVLAYAVTGGLPVYSGPLTVDLPGATDGGTPATFTSTNDLAAKVKIGLKANTGLFGGVTLTSFSAPVIAPGGSAGTTACGSVGMNLGPQVGTGTDQIATLKGGMNLAFPTSGPAAYQMIGKLAVPTWKTAGGSLGIASLGLLEGQPTASVKLALGTGTSSGVCPLAKLPAPTALTLKTGVTVKGQLTGTEGDAVYFLQGPATFTYPAVTVLPATATGTVVVNEVGLSACANVAGHAGLYGFSMTWAGVFSSYATGNCVLPTTSTGFGCLTQSAAAAGLWQFSGCFSTPATGQFASTLPATLDGLGLDSAGGTSTVLIDTGAKTATVPSGGAVTVPRGTTSSTVCTGPLTLNLAAASVSCTPPAATRLFGLAVTGAATLKPQAGGLVDGSAPVRLPGILGSPAGTLNFVVSGTGVLTSASVVPSASASIAGLVSDTITSMTLNVTTGLWSVVGSVATSTGATATLTATVNYDATGNLSVGTLKIGRVDLGGAVTWTALSITYSTVTKLWTGTPTVVGAVAAGAMSLNVVDATGTVTAGALTTGPVSLFSALPLGSLALKSAGSVWNLTSTPAGAGSGTVSAAFAVTAGRITGATITQNTSPISLYGQLPASSGLFAYSVVAGAPVYTGALTVALPGATASATPATLTSTNDGPAVVKVATTSTTALFGGIDVTSITAPVKAATATVGTTVCGPSAMNVGPTVGIARIATLKGGLSFVYPKTGAVPYQLIGKLAVPTWKTGGGGLGVATVGLVQGQVTGSVKLALGTGTGSGVCPLPALPVATTLTLAKNVTVSGTLTGTEGDGTFLLKGAGTFSYPAVTVLPAKASGTITVNETGMAACAVVTGQTGKYGFSMTWAGVFTAYSTGNCTLPTTSTG
jgi:PKD repeat protein